MWISQSERFYCAGPLSDIADVVTIFESEYILWLNGLPMKKQNLYLNKENFRDALRLKYGIPLEYLPSKCACCEKFNKNHVISCKKYSIVKHRHNNIGDFFTTCLDLNASDFRRGVDKWYFSTLNRNLIKIRRHRRDLVSMNKKKTRKQWNNFRKRILIFGTNGGMGEECSRFVSALERKLSKIKQNEEYSVVISWLRVRLSNS